MDKGKNGNDDEEPQICTVFSSTPSSQSKTIFDTIAYSIPKKTEESKPPVTIQSASVAPTAAPSSSFVEQTVLPETRNDDIVLPSSAMFESLTMSYIGTDSFQSPSGNSEGLITPTYSLSHPLASLHSEEPLMTPVPSITPTEGHQTIPSEANLRLLTAEIDSLSLNEPCATEKSEDSPLPTANTLFSDAPEVPFPVGTGVLSSNSDNLPGTNANTASLIPESILPQENPTLIDEFSKATYSSADLIYDAWIPSEQTRQALTNITNAVNAGTYFPDKDNMTTPGIIYKEDLVDKVSVNMSRIFGEVEANKRKILTADSVTQDDNGIRELIKLGCYRSAINLTKRILTLYGQGPGKLGQFSKHTPHSLQLWMTRIALLVRIREFKIAESELEAFKDFDNPDMYYEYYQDLYGQGRVGSMVPFYFRLIGAEIPQYSSKDYNKSVNMLNLLLETVQKIIKNVEEGKNEDGASSSAMNEDRRNTSLQIWKKRELRVQSSLANAFLLAKDFPNTLRCFQILREKDDEKKAQLTSAIGRLFLQYGDLTTSQKYFKEAAALRAAETDTDRVENLIDASLYFIAQGVYTDAFGLLKEALAIQPDNFMITNNMAVCLLYMGKVKDSLALMEATVRNNTPQLLQENVILNLSTIYELENSDGFKKNALLKLISEYKGDGINLASLKMPNLI